jgi:hypothetical protein
MSRIEIAPTSRGEDAMQAKYRPVRSPLISMGPSLEDARRRRMLVIRVGLVGCGLAIALAVVMVGKEWLFGESTPQIAESAQVLTGPLGRPEPLTLATVPAEGVEDPLRIQLPIVKRGITAIGYSRHSSDGLLALEPAGNPAEQSTVGRTLAELFGTQQASGLRWWSLDGTSEPNIVHVGARAGSDVYAPVPATVVAVANDVVDGRDRGDVVQLQLLGDERTLIVVRGIDADQNLSVGQSVTAGTTRLGTVREPDKTVRTALAEFSHDDGAAVELYVRSTQLRSAE